MARSHCIRKKKRYKNSNKTKHFSFISWCNSLGIFRPMEASGIQSTSAAGRSGGHGLEFLAETQQASHSLEDLCHLRQVTSPFWGLNSLTLKGLSQREGSKNPLGLKTTGFQRQPVSQHLDTWLGLIRSFRYCTFYIRVEYPPRQRHSFPRFLVWHLLG